MGYKHASKHIGHVVQENASKIIREQGILEVAEQDRQRVVDEINNPTEPSDSFRSAAEFYRNTFKH